MAMWDWVPPVDPDFMLSVVTCGQYGGWSDSGFCDKRYDRMYSRQQLTPNEAQLKNFPGKGTAIAGRQLLADSLDPVGIEPDEGQREARPQLVLHLLQHVPRGDDQDSLGATPRVSSERIIPISRVLPRPTASAMSNRGRSRAGSSSPGRDHLGSLLRRTPAG